MRTLTVITEPVEEPVTVQEAKDALRINSLDEDVRIGNIIRAARMFVEGYCSIKICSQVVELSLDSWPSSVIKLGVWPIQSIDSIKYDDTASPTAEQTLTVNTDYYADTITINGRIVAISGWPSVASKFNPIRIRMTVGAVDQASVPNQIKEGIMAYCAYIYDSDILMKDISERLLWSERIM